MEPNTTNKTSTFFSLHDLKAILQKHLKHQKIQIEGWGEGQ